MNELEKKGEDGRMLLGMILAHKEERDLVERQLQRASGFLAGRYVRPGGEKGGRYADGKIGLRRRRRL